MFVSQNLREYHVIDQGQTLVCTNTICQYVYILNLCTISVNHHLSNSAIPCLVFLLCQLAAFVYYVFNHFICYHITYTCNSFVHIINFALMQLVFMASLLLFGNNSFLWVRNWHKLKFWWFFSFLVVKTICKDDIK